MLLGIKKLCFRSFLVTMTAAVTLGSAFNAGAETVIYTNNGTIEGKYGYEIEANGQISQIDNYGIITGTKKAVVVDADFGFATVNNYAGAQMTGQSSHGVEFKDFVSGVVNNWGSITSQGNDGIKSDNGSLSVANYAGSSIWAYDNGIDADQDVNVYNYGTITAEQDTAINSDGNGYVFNAGTIRSGTDTTSNGDSDGIDYDYKLTLDNYGTIESLKVKEAEAVSMGYGTIINHEGALIYSAKEGIRVVGLDGTGDMVYDPEGNPIGRTRPAMSSTKVFNSGTIEAANGTAIHFGGNNNAADYNHRVENHGGSIVGRGGVAVQFAGGSDQMIFEDSAGTIVGDIDGAGGNDEFEVKLDAGQVQVLDDDILNFEKYKQEQPENTVILNGYAQLGKVSMRYGTLLVNGTLEAANGIDIGFNHSNWASIFGGDGTVIGDVSFKGTVTAGTGTGETETASLVFKNDVTVDTTFYDGGFETIMQLDILSWTEFDTIAINGTFDTTAGDGDEWYLDLYFGDIFDSEEDVLSFNVWSAFLLNGDYSDEVIEAMVVRYYYHESLGDTDYTIVSARGAEIGSPSAVPVPGTVGLMFGGLILMSAVRRRNA